MCILERERKREFADRKGANEGSKATSTVLIKWIIDNKTCTIIIKNPNRRNSRYKKIKCDIPGPGQYRIPTSIVDVPNRYIATGGKFMEEFKFVWIWFDFLL